MPAGLAEKPKEFAWSCAAAHRTREGEYANPRHGLLAPGGVVERWAELHAGAGDEAETNRLRTATYGGKLWGSTGFVEEVQTPWLDIDDSEIGRPVEEPTPEPEKREGQLRWGLARLE